MIYFPCSRKYVSNSILNQVESLEKSQTQTHVGVFQHDKTLNLLHSLIEYHNIEDVGFFCF